MEYFEKNGEYYIKEFENGVRAVVRQSRSAVSYVGALVNAGSRDEDADKQGLAHFVEHTIFKGTEKRKSWHISNRMETIGGELNAYTTKEETMVYTNAPAGYIDRSLDLISDLFMNASFPRVEIEREKEVVIEEIHSYKDSPAESVFDDFEEAIYAGSAMAHNILGSVESVRGLGSEDALNFIKGKYTGRNIVVYCSDPGTPERNMSCIEHYFKQLPACGVPNNRVVPEILSPFDKRVEKGNHQANVIAGCRLFGRRDERRHAMFLLNNYLGGPCMNSRLNMEMRDKRGLVYTVESNVALMSDCGLSLIYFGTDPSSVKRCLRLINNQIDALAQSAMSERKFAKIRDQYCGQLIVGSEMRESRAMAMAKSLMYFDEIHDIGYTTECIQSLSPEDMRMAAELVARQGLSSFTIV